ncbi:hemerythrin family protein [Methylomonas sp. EFPC1]|uniref:Hemerythrin family protein n=1 Tax=Methylomonas defluvii TaxID=3045149 RepID=A0ABU4UFM9_9GAMM|nr:MULTISPECIES: hemerythrin family protein [unclassified Methylomonas]MDX8127722.1 hemerythrin family protein [Methylomonas sp. OY6]NOV29114.1 hemerythrin [Methylomonas sp. ZR1]PKD40392.1 hemerythrin [Methylomonas sp. Kb3]QBC27916.1 hemerythrin [Methylomonas sp. LW13]QSB03170.1 hemerythrin family protein [Methylomonas sp. EFPC1]
MTIFDRTIPLSVGYAHIDHDHGIFIDLVNQLDKANNTDFPGLFAQLYQHTEEHFESENRLMAQFGFPAETEHKGEHQRVLEEFKQFKTRIDKGLISFGRAFVKERLPQWFLLHITTMDSALASHIKAQQELQDE